MGCLIDKTILEKMENYLLSTSLYKTYLRDSGGYEDLYDYLYYNDSEIVEELDNAINLVINEIDVNTVVEGIDDYLKFLIVYHFIEEYDSKEDLNESIVYYYAQIMFLLNIKDSLLNQFYEGMVVESNKLIEIYLKGTEIDIIHTLKYRRFNLPILDMTKSNIGFHKGYLLSFVHTNLDYAEQFKVLSKLEKYSDDDWYTLFCDLKKVCKVRDTQWFVY